MTELVECNTQLHKTLQGLWSDALTQHKLQQHIHQQDWISQRVPCCCLGHKAPFKPLGAYVITRPTFLGQRNAVEVVSVFLIQPKPIIDSQNTLFVEIFIVEDLLSTEHKSQLQDRPICPNTLDCRDKFKVLALQLHMVTLFL